MRLWPWRAEHRHDADPDIGQLVANALATGASGDAPLVSALASLESAAGLWGRSLALATPSPAAPWLTPALLETIGRRLCVDGEYLAAIDVDFDGALRLDEARGHQVVGGLDRSTWRYSLDLEGPNRLFTRSLPAEGVVHVTFSTARGRPWKGLSPLAQSPATADMAAHVEAMLQGESHTSHGYLFALADSYNVQGWGVQHVAGDTAAARAGRTALRTAKGRHVFVGDVPREQGTTSGWHNIRYGMDPPAVVTALRESLKQAVYEACGVSHLMQSTGAGVQAAWRSFIGATIEPISLTIAAELGEKLGMPGLQLDLSRLRATDRTATARAVKGFVDAGVPLDEALHLAGID